MANLLPITKEPHKILRKKAAAVPTNEISKIRIHGLIARMKETLANIPDGIGLAAPQVGESLQIFIVSEEAEEIDRVEKKLVKKEDLPNAGVHELVAKREWKYHVFVNPTVKNISKRKLERTEGCLSVPGTFGSVKRNEKITVEAYDENGKKFTRGTSCFFARVIQHELDHLSGTLFIDKAERIFKPEPEEPAVRNRSA